MSLPKLPVALRAARVAAGMSLSDLAASAGYKAAPRGGNSVLTRYESGAVVPSLATVAALVAAIGAPLVFELNGVDVAVTPRKAR
jgi:transcriptional regulator with XRE-family HTH domain